MDRDEIASVLDFLQRSEALKDTLRSAYTSAGKQESTAEHTWRLCLMAMLFCRFQPDVDVFRVVKMCIVHDLAEAVTGDTPAPDQSRSSVKRDAEIAAIGEMTSGLPDDIRSEVLELWNEYDAGKSTAAVFAKGFDKLETILQHNIGRNPEDFDYEFNLDYGRKQTDAHPILKQIRELVDEMTVSRIKSSS